MHSLQILQKLSKWVLDRAWVIWFGCSPASKSFLETCFLLDFEKTWVCGFCYMKISIPNAGFFFFFSLRYEFRSALPWATIINFYFLFWDTVLLTCWGWHRTSCLSLLSCWVTIIYHLALCATNVWNIDSTLCRGS